MTKKSLLEVNQMNISWVVLNMFQCIYEISVSFAFAFRDHGSTFKLYAEAQTTGYTTPLQITDLNGMDVFIRKNPSLASQGTD